jgi:hypothetical protein
MASGYTKTDFNHDALIAGDFPILTKSITVAHGAGSLVRGTLLGKKTADGKYLTSLSAAVDGSEVPVAILAEPVNAAAGDVVTTAYESGEFNEDRMTIGTGHTANSVRDALRAISIFLKKAMPR